MDVNELSVIGMVNCKEGWLYKRLEVRPIDFPRVYSARKIYENNSSYVFQLFKLFSLRTFCGKQLLKPAQKTYVPTTHEFSKHITRWIDELDNN